MRWYKSESFLDRPFFAASMAALINAALEIGIVHFGQALDEAGRALADEARGNAPKPATVLEFPRKYRAQIQFRS